jgi:hypothetical protein
MKTPFDSKEFSEQMLWQSKSNQNQLNVIDCISAWTDICGFGSLLERDKWDLTSSQKNGVFILLNNFHAIAGRPLLVNPDKLPNDKVILLNDGIARTIDMYNSDKLSAIQFLMFFRELLCTHYHLLQLTNTFGVGVRTILAGGQRVQYSPTSMSGHSFLHYDENNVSQFGKAILNTNFVYNPAEFQMNTAFAKAFTIDGLGTKANIKINGLYIESSFFEKLDKIKQMKIQLQENKIILSKNNTPMFDLSIASKDVKNIKGIEMIVYHIDKFFIFKEFDGDDIDFDMFNIVNDFGTFDRRDT